MFSLWSVLQRWCHCVCVALGASTAHSLWPMEPFDLLFLFHFFLIFSWQNFRLINISFRMCFVLFIFRFLPSTFFSLSFVRCYYFGWPNRNFEKHFSLLKINFRILNLLSRNPQANIGLNVEKILGESTNPFAALAQQLWLGLLTKRLSLCRICTRNRYKRPFIVCVWLSFSKRNVWLISYPNKHYVI